VGRGWWVVGSDDAGRAGMRPGEPGASPDRFWIEVKDKDGQTVTLSMLPDAGENAQELHGGKIVVPHGGGKGKGGK
jgi:hypothetical protein